MKIAPAINYFLRYVTLFTLCIILFSNNVLANTSIGIVNKLAGVATAKLPDEDTRQLNEGANIYLNDKITTYENTSIKFNLSDNTKFELGAETEILVNDFVYKKDITKDSVSINILKGTFRFVTGLIAKKKPAAMKVQTVVATLGIRGTHVIGEADATSATVILMEPEGEFRETAIEVSNSFGSVVIDKPGYGTEVPDEFSPPSPPRRMRVQTINNLTRSMQSVQRINIPRPRVP